METAGYAALSRMSGLMKEMRVVANNVANANTTGYRQEGVIFSEFVQMADGDMSVAMSAARIGQTSFAQGALEPTGGRFDFAIESDGFFLVQTPNGERLTRAGAFSPSAEGNLVTPDGYPVLDAGGAPIFLPGNSSDLKAGSDGTLSADGQLIGQLGIVRPLNPQAMQRETGLLFNAEEGFEPIEEPMIVQGFVESSNVNPILQMARMVEIQRAYELGQSFLEREDERVRSALKTFIE